MRRIALMGLCFSMLLLSTPSAGAASVSAQSAILMDADTGAALYEKNADERRDIASVTKLMTALVVVEHCEPAECVRVAREAVGVEGSSIELYQDEELAVETLLYGLLLESGNDAAAALALHVAESIDGFASLMNERAEQLGCMDTCFQNPHGLTQEGHYSTARDLAAIMSAVMEHPLLSKIMATQSITIEGRTFHNHNKLLNLYQSTTGGKTGYTQAAGRTLVTSAQRDGIRLVCVTLDDGDDWNDHIRLYEECFDSYTEVQILTGEEFWQVPVISGTRGFAVVTAEPISLWLREAEMARVETNLPRFLYAPCEAGDTAGYVAVYVNGEERARCWLTIRLPVPLNEQQRLTGVENWFHTARLMFAERGFADQ